MVDGDRFYPRLSYIIIGVLIRVFTYNPIFLIVHCPVIEIGEEPLAMKLRDLMPRVCLYNLIIAKVVKQR